MTARTTTLSSPTTSPATTHWPSARASTIEWQGTDQFETEINVRLQGGDPPDIIDYPQPGLMIGHARAGYLQPLPDDLAATVRDDFSRGSGSSPEPSTTCSTALPARTERQVVGLVQPDGVRRGWV